MAAPTVLIVANVWVEPNSSAAGSRMLQLITQFLNHNYKVIFACTAQKTPNALNLEALGVTEVSIALNNSAFDEFITKLQPNCVLFDRFLAEEQFGWRVTQYCPKALRILDTEDLHCLRKTREICYKKQVPFTVDVLRSQDITKREIAAILRCDVSLIISTYELELLKNEFKIDAALLCYLPFLIPEITTAHQKLLPTFANRHHFIFIGNYYHKPNVNAVLTLKKYIWPLIKHQLPKAELYIYGAYVTQQINELHSPKDGFFVKGFAETATVVMQQAKILLAPLLFGAGIKGKLTEAMQCGTPSVTTSIGAEGMHSNLPWGGAIQNDFTAFAEQAVHLYTNKNQWLVAQNNGFAIINSLYNTKTHATAFFNTITNLQNTLTAHRTTNFLGSLLQHQTLQATKYMSKWIEEKNKL